MMVYHVALVNRQQQFEWGIFTALAMIPIVLPYLTVSNYANNYVDGIAKNSKLYNAIKKKK
jgi:hypothetical protein